MYRLSSRLNRRRNHSARTGSVSAAPRNWSKSPPTGPYHHGLGPEARCSTRSPIAVIVHTGNVDFAVALLNSRARSAARRLERPAKVARLQKAHRHALPERGIEAGDGVAERQDAGREALQLVVAAPPAGRVFVEGHVADWLALPDRGCDVWGKDFVGQRTHLREILWRFDFGHAEGRQAPGAVLVVEHAETTRLLAGGARDDDLLGDQTVRNAQLVCGVSDADVDTVLGWAVKSPLLQPDR